MAIPTPNLKIQTVKISELNPAPYNPRRWSEDATVQLGESIRTYGLVYPLLVNQATGRENVVIGGHFRLKVAKDLGYAEVPVVFVKISDIEREKELNLRMNKNLGEFDNALLKDFDEVLLADIGFTSEEIDDIFDEDIEEKETFDLRKALDKAGVQEIKAKPGDIYQLGDSRLMVGDSTVEADVLNLMDGEKADMCLTDPRIFWII